MKTTLRDKYTRRTSSAMGSLPQQDYVIQRNLQPELNYTKFNTIFSSQLGRKSIDPLDGQQQMGNRQRPKDYMIPKKINTIQNSSLHSRELQTVKTEILYPKVKQITPYNNSKSQSIQFADQQNNFNSLNKASTVRNFPQIDSVKEIQNLLNKEKLINLEFKEETQNLRAQIYQLRNVQIELEKIKIYLRKLQNQVSDQLFDISQIKQENQSLRKRLNQNSVQLQILIKESQLMQNEMIKANNTIQEFTQKNLRNEEEWAQEKQKLNSYIKQLQKESFEKSHQITELYQQNEKLSQNLQESKRENIQLYQNYENSMKVIHLMQDKVNQLKEKFSERQNVWLKEVNQYEILFKKLEKIVQDKSQQNSALQAEVISTNEQITKLRKSFENESQLLANNINKLKNENQKVKQENENLRLNQSNMKIDEEQNKREYVPKKWFEQKIEYEYTLNALQNQLENLRQQNQYLMQKSKILEQKVTEKRVQQGLQINIHDKVSAQTQTEEINLGEIELEKSEKSRIIEEQELKILSLQTQLNQVHLNIKSEKNSFNEKYQIQIRQKQEHYKNLQKLYKEEKQKLDKQKQRTEDLTMELLLLEKQIKQSKIKIKSKQYL